MAETQKVVAILISPYYIMYSFKYCDVKFAHRVYKEAHEYRSPSVVPLNANCNRKTARQEANLAFCSNYINSNKLKIHFLNSSNTGHVGSYKKNKMRAGFCGLVFSPAHVQIVFHERFQIYTVRVDAQKRFENDYVWTR